MGTQSLPQKWAQPTSPIFSPFLLRLNCCMHHDATCCGRRPHPSGLCVRLGPAHLSKKGTEPPIFGPCLLRPNGCVDQDTTWYGGRPQPRRLCVKWGPALLPKKGAEPPPQFSAHVHCDQTAGWIKMALDMEVGLGPRHIVLDGDRAPLPQKRAESPPF